MQLIPVIIQYPNPPFAVTIAHQVTAQRMVQDISRVFNRITKKAMQFSDQTLLLDSPNPISDLLQNGGVRNVPGSWADVRAILHANGLDERLDVYCVWHANQLNDITGISQPAAPHRYDNYINAAGQVEVSDPALGGIATNGFGQIANALGSDWEGEHYRNMLLYAAHEVGHALGRHHTPHPDTGLSDPVYNALNSIMGYGYANFASGSKSGTPPQWPNPMLAIPEEIVTWRAHSIFRDVPDRLTATEPGWADDLVLVRRDDQLAMLDELATANGRGRLLIGSLTAEIGDPIE